MKTFSFRTRWFFLLPLAATVAFLVNLNIVNRVNHFLDEQGFEIILQKQIFDMISSDNPAEDSKEETSSETDEKEAPCTMPEEQCKAGGVTAMALQIET